MSIIIKCSDEAATNCDVDERVALQCGILKNFIDMQSGDLEGKFLLPEFISSETFTRVLYHLRDAKERDKLELVDQICGDVRLEKVHKLVAFVKAVDYLGAQRLVDAACQVLAHKIRFLSPLEIRKLFNIVGDNTPEAEARAKAWKAWRLY